MKTYPTYLDVDSATSEHEADVMRMANLCSRLFRVTGKHIGFELFPADLAPLGDSSTAGVLMAAMELRDALAASPKGRQALKNLGFEPSSEDVESE